MNKLIILVALFLAVTSQCISPENKIVDWFVMLKMPGVYKTVYGNAGGPTLKAISAELTDEGSPIARTIAGIYKGTADNYLMYNDQVPDGPVSHRRGHTKGEMNLSFNINIASTMLTMKQTKKFLTKHTTLNVINLRRLLFRFDSDPRR